MYGFPFVLDGGITDLLVAFPFSEKLLLVELLKRFLHRFVRDRLSFFLQLGLHGVFHGNEHFTKILEHTENWREKDLSHIVGFVILTFSARTYGK